MFDLTITDTGIWIPVIALGILIRAGGSAWARFARRSWTWSVADAVITKVSGLNLDSLQAVGPNRWDTTMKIHIEYSYMVKGIQWKNEYIARWRSTGAAQFREAEIFRQNNPVGKRFQLLYNPDNPFDSLMNGPRDPSIGLAAAAFGLALAVYGLINWLADPALPGQIALLAAGLIGAAVVHYMSEYPFERPWWLDKTEEEAAQFIRDADSVKSADPIMKHQA